MPHDKEEKRDSLPVAGLTALRSACLRQAGRCYIRKRITEKLCRKLGEKLWSEEKDVPEDVNGGVDDGRGEDRTGFAPGPSVEESGDGG